jgi:hypothetical protein
MSKNNRLSFLFVLFFANIMFLTANLPFYHRLQLTPTGQLPTYQHHHVYMDYLGYLAYIRESQKQGVWRFRDLYTTEETVTNGNFFYFTLLGKISQLFGLSPTSAYHLVRLIQFEIFIFFVIIFTNSILGKVYGAIAALLFLVLSPPAWIFHFLPYSLDGVGWHPWSVLSPWRRADMLPHHGASMILAILEVNFLLLAIRTKKFIYSFFSAVFAFFSVIFHPAVGLLYLIGQPLTYLIHIISIAIKNKRFTLPSLTAITLPSVLSVTAILLVRYEILHSYPYNTLINGDVWWFDRYSNYIPLFFQGGGFALVSLFLITLIVFTFSRNFLWHLLAIWSLLPFLVIPVSTQMGVAKFRFGLLLHYLPQAILFAKAFQIIMEKLKHRLLKIIICASILVGFFSATAASLFFLYRDWNQQMGKIEPGMYYSAAEMAAINFLKSNAPPYSHVLCGEIHGMLIPAYASVITFVGQYASSIDFEAKKVAVRQFFGGYYDPGEAQSLIRTHNINYLFVGAEERAWGEAHLNYNLNLTPVFTMSDVTVYQLN